MKSLTIIEPEILIKGYLTKIDINGHSYFSSDLLRISDIYLSTYTGYISFKALRFLSSLEKYITVTNINNEHIYDLIPYRHNRDYSLRIKQYKALEHKSEIAKKIIELKHKKYNELLTELNLKTIRINYHENIFSKFYFNQIRELFKSNGYEYKTRKGKMGFINVKADNPINAVLNYYYGYTEHKLLREIDIYGLDFSLPYLHSQRKGSLNLIYDVVELLRNRVDRLVIKLTENKVIKQSDFKALEGYLMIANTRKYNNIYDKSISRSILSQAVEEFIQLL